VLEHCTDGGTGLPANWAGGPGDDWSHAASAEQLALAGLAPDTVACWHTQAGWVRPAALVQAQLNHPQIRFQPSATIARLQRDARDGRWQAFSAQEQMLAEADMVVLACGPATAGLLPADLHWPLQPIRGQISWGPHHADNAAALPPFPVNGNGNLVTHIPLSQGPSWVMGSTFERDVTQLPISAADQAAAHAVNHGKLSTLLSASAATMAPWFDLQDIRCLPTWGRVRVASHDRLPIAGPVMDAAGQACPGLWALTALGARGLTLSVLCAELLAARLHGEPLPLDAKLAQHLGTERLQRRMPS
jgi:tRNA 5-methylaminomethyl-2-thiouridine biosynthesis bifunctional protein